jgi:C-terminal processing protease CtpA/Prc
MIMNSTVRLIMIFYKVITNWYLKLSLIVFTFFFCLSPEIVDSQQIQINRQDKEKLIKKISKLLEEKYVIPEVGKKCAKDILLALTSNAYDYLTGATEFAEKLTADLQRITNDKHVKFRLIEASDLGESREGSLHHPVRLFRLMQKENLGFTRFDWIEGDIGYLEIRRFYSPSEAREMVIAAMNFVAGADAIIIDLRENQGGAGELLPFFCSYFFEKSTQLSSYYSREDDFTREFWTLNNFPDRRLIDVPLFLLTSKKTFSAAEMFAYDLKVRQRAVLIGDSTGGGAHSVDLFKIDDRFEIYISTSRAIHPLTKSNWEGIGVIPDIIVPSEMAYDTAIVLARKAARSHAEARDTELKGTVQRMQIQIDKAGDFYIANKDISAEAVLDSAFQIGMKANLINEFFIQVLIYHYLSVDNDKLLFALLRKNIELYTNSADAYGLMAWVCSEHGQEEIAIQNYEKVLELDQNNSTAKKMLQKLKQ